MGTSCCESDCGSVTSPHGASFLTELPSSSSDSTDVKECSLPFSFDALPANVQSLSTMRRALEQVDFTKREHEARFSRCWFSQPCEEMLITSVWLCVCTKFRPEAEHAREVRRRAAEEVLFPQLAAAYARVFSLELSVETKDCVAWYLPEALGFAAAAVITEAFPKSRHLIDAAALPEVLTADLVKLTSGFGGMRTLSQQRKQLPRGVHADALGTRAPSSGGKAATNANRLPDWLQSQLVPGVCAATASPPVFSRKSPNWRAPDVGGGGDTRARRSAALAPLPKAKAELRDIGACSPLMAEWLHTQRSASARESSSSPGLSRSGHGGPGHHASPRRQGSPRRHSGSGHCVSYSNPAPRVAAEAEMQANSARTYRSVRIEAARKIDRLSVSASAARAKTESETLACHNASVAARRLLRATERSLDVAQLHEVANYLTALRRMEDGAPDLEALCTLSR